MPAQKEYELVPIKPIKELRAEIKKLQANLSKNSSPKELTQLLNSNIETQRAVKSMLKKMSETKDHISNLVEIFEAVEGEELGGDDPHPKIVERLDSIEEQNQKISQDLEKIQNELRRLSYFKEHLPPGLPIVYRRSGQPSNTTK